MAITATDKVLVLLKSSDIDHDFVCNKCGAYVARLKGCEVAPLTEEETYAVSALFKQKEDHYTGVRATHKGKSDNGPCKVVYSFYAVNQGIVRVGTVVKIEGPYAAAL